MDLIQAAAMAKATGSHGTVTMHIDKNGTITIGKISLWGATREAILRYKKEHNIPKINKKYYESWEDIDYIFDNVRFNKVEVCKIVGYKEVKVAATTAHTKKIPIYKCKNNTL